MTHLAHGKILMGSLKVLHSLTKWLNYVKEDLQVFLLLLHLG